MLEGLFQTRYPINKVGNFNGAQTDTVIWTPSNNKRIILCGVVISVDTAMNCQLEASDVDVIPPLYLDAKGGAVISGYHPIWVGQLNEALALTTSGAGNVSIVLWGWEA